MEFVMGFTIKLGEDEETRLGSSLESVCLPAASSKNKSRPYLLREEFTCEPMSRIL